MLLFSATLGNFRCTLQSWAYLSRLARLHGWIPQDPLTALTIEGDFAEADPDAANPETREPWSMAPEFVQPLRLSVSDRDASALAEALEAALPDVPRFDALDHKAIFTLDLPEFPTARVIPSGQQVGPYEYFSGANRSALERFVAICRSGNLVVSQSP